MEAQQYKNHIRYYPAHHFVFYPAILLLVGVSIYFALNAGETAAIWIFLSVLTALVGFLSYMMRQHYAMMVQNRVVRLELRFRYYLITQQRFELIESKLKKSQLYALRFASDDELPYLVMRAMNENLSGDEIKKAIIHWIPDHMRV
jgi:hypothetical protein